jgi:DNA-binding transcriptional regulator YiaG
MKITEIDQHTELDKLNIREPKASILSRLYKNIQNNTHYMVMTDKSVPCWNELIHTVEFSRDQYGLTQAEFASLLGMLPSHYSEFINGKRSFPQVAMKRAFAIGIPAETLLKEYMEAEINS